MTIQRLILSFSLFAALFFTPALLAKTPLQIDTGEGQIAIIDMDMMILPGTQGYLEKSIERAYASGAKLLIVRLNTPGGILQTTQKMVQAIFESPIPIVVYVSPGGSTATSAGVFLTLAGHVAAMAPGTSLGAAHPVGGDGKDIEGDMRKKAEEMAIAFSKSIADRRDRNVKWAEDAVRESASITEKEALEKNVIDLVADNEKDLLRKIAGREVKVLNETVVLEDYSDFEMIPYNMTVTDQVVNVLANPNIAALLWLAATTGISIELYNPGAILPGVVGVICLLLALAVSQIIPISYSGILLIAVGTLLIGAEIYVPSGLLGIGGVIAIAFGLIYLVDIGQAPGLEVDPAFVFPLLAVFIIIMAFVVRAALRGKRQGRLTGEGGMVGMEGEVTEPVSREGKVFVDGEIWNATAEKGLIDRGTRVKVTAVEDGLVLKVAPVEEKTETS